MRDAAKDATNRKSLLMSRRESGNLCGNFCFKRLFLVFFLYEADAVLQCFQPHLRHSAACAAPVNYILFNLLDNIAGVVLTWLIRTLLFAFQSPQHFFRLRKSAIFRCE